jgi:hypothetical protein
MVTYSILKKYSQGYGEPAYDYDEDMIDIAHLFWRLGSETGNLEAAVEKHYAQTVKFLVRAVRELYDNYRPDRIRITVAERPLLNEEEPDEGNSSYVLVIAYVNIEHAQEPYPIAGLTLKWDGELANDQRFLDFVGLASRAAQDCLACPYEPDIFETFPIYTKYAFLLGTGWSLEDAISARHREVQELVSGFTYPLTSMEYCPLPDIKYSYN